LGSEKLWLFVTRNKLWAAAALGKQESQNNPGRRGFSDPPTACSLGKEGEMALDPLPFSGAQIMEKEGIFLGCFPLLAGWEKSSLPQIFQAMSVCVLLSMNTCGTRDACLNP
jgi:hypothetical protein